VIDRPILPDKRADILIVQGDHTQDIRALLHVRAVYSTGKLVEQAV